MEDLVLMHVRVNVVFLVVQLAVRKGDGQGILKGRKREIPAFQPVQLTAPKHRLCAWPVAPCSLCSTEHSELWNDK